MTILKAAGKETKDSLMRMLNTRIIKLLEQPKKPLYAFEFSNSWHDHSGLPV